MALRVVAMRYPVSAIMLAVLSVQNYALYTVQHVQVQSYRFKLSENC